MTYIERLNDFNRWLESNALEPVSQLMYFKLLNVFNRAGWPDSVQVDNPRLMSMTGCTSEKSARAARDRLISAGLITYQRGKKGIPGRYALTAMRRQAQEYTADSYPDSLQNEGQKIPGKKYPVNFTGNMGSNQDSNRDVITPGITPPYKDKDKDEDEDDNIPPNPPAGGTGPVVQVPVENAPSPTREEPPKRKRGTRQNDPSRSPELTPDEEATLMGYSPGLCAAVRDWFHYKAERREMYGATFRRTFFGKIAENAPKYGADAVAKLITDSLSYGWKGVMWDKLEGAERRQGGGCNGGYGSHAGRPSGLDTGANPGQRQVSANERWRIRNGLDSL